MILNSKQLEELENIQDASGEFDEDSGDSDGYVEGVENALAWRRGMIERAVSNIRKIVRSPLDSSKDLVSGSLVYLKESKRFVRVVENADGKNELSFVSAGPLVELAPKAKKAEKPKRAKKEVQAEQKEPKSATMDQREQEAKQPKATKATKDAAKKEPKAKAKPEKAIEKLTKEAKKQPKVEPEKSKSKTTLKAGKKPTASKKVPLKSKSISKKKPVLAEKARKKEKSKVKVIEKPKKASLGGQRKKETAKKPLQKKKNKKAASTQKSISGYSSKNADPVADPNGYIRGNYRLMSNKELSHVTGLSEHTIRRKLGEWGLKRL